MPDFDARPLAVLVRTQLTMVDLDQQSFSVIDDLDSWISSQQEWQHEHLIAWIFGICCK